MGRIPTAQLLEAQRIGAVPSDGERAPCGLANDRFREPDEDDVTVLIGAVRHVFESVEHLGKRMCEEWGLSAVEAQPSPANVYPTGHGTDRRGGRHRRVARLAVGRGRARQQQPRRAGPAGRTASRSA
jgi:hypothetical protein